MRRKLAKIAATLILLILSGVLLLVALAPTCVHSYELSQTFNRYTHSPTEENRRKFEQTANRVNRPVHIVQGISLLCGIILPFGTIRIWKKRKPDCGFTAPPPGRDSL